MGMSFEEKGAYIELLMAQFNRGHMTYHMCGQIVGQNLWESVKHKFVQDAEGLYYNVRLDEEKIKRQNFTQSRRNNMSGKNQHSKKGHMTPHMENENEDENKDSSVITTKGGTGGKNDEWKKRYMESPTIIEYGKKILETCKVKCDEENLFHLLDIYVNKLNHDGIVKQNFNDFTKHFGNWINAGGFKKSIPKRPY